MHSPSRRRVLLAACALGLAGCASDDGDDTDTGDNGASATMTETPAPTPEATPTGTQEATPTDAETPGETPTATPVEVHEEYETREVTVRSADGEVLGSVTAAVADTSDLRYLGLSDTEFLPEDRGMLFVYDEVRDLTFVMREMDFPIDIVYADDEGVITSIHHARAPGPDEDGNDLRFPGRGQYVLEVNHHWTTDRGVGEGDVLAFEL
jgi:uncharacterized membrane protein (UPF0127 family)